MFLVVCWIFLLNKLEVTAVHKVSLGNVDLFEFFFSFMPARA